MKNTRLKKFLLALGLVSVTLNTYALASCCETVDLDKIVASYTSDTTFEIYIKADENMHFQTKGTPSYAIYGRLVQNNGSYIPAKVSLHDDDGTGTDEFKIVVSGLDFGSRLYYSWVDLVTMGKLLFKNYDYSRREYRRIEFYGTSQFHRGDKDYDDDPNDDDNTGWDHVDNEMHAVEQGERWNKQQAIANKTDNAVSHALVVAENTADMGMHLNQKWENLKDAKVKISLNKTEIQKLLYTSSSMLSEHSEVYNYLTDRNDKFFTEKAKKVEEKLVAFWQNQKNKVIVASAKAIQAKDETALFKLALNEYLIEINLLKRLMYTPKEKEIVVQHEVNHSNLNNVLNLAMANDEGERNTIIAITTTSSAEEAAQVVTFTPKLVEGWKIYTISINDMHQSVPVNANMDIKEMVESFSLKMQGNPVVSCNENSIKLTCTAKKKDLVFSYSTIVEDTTQDEVELSKAKQNALVVKIMQSKATQSTKASYIVKDLNGQDYIKIVSTKEGTLGNNSYIRYRSFMQDSGICKLSDLEGEDVVTCGKRGTTQDLLATVNNEFWDKGLTAELANDQRRGDFVTEVLGNVRRTWWPTGGVDSVPGRQVVSFSPTLANAYKTYIININGLVYSIPVNSKSSLKEIVDALALELSVDTAVTCLEDNITLTCSSATPGNIFTFDTWVFAREPNQSEIKVEEWDKARAAVVDALKVSVDLNAVLALAMQSDEALPSKLLALNNAKRVNENLRIKIQLLEAAKQTEEHDTDLIEFNAELQRLNTARNVFQQQYDEAVEAKAAAVWNPQLTLTSAALTVANTAQTTATSSMRSGDTLPSKSLAVSASKDANTKLYVRIQALEGVKTTNVHAAVIADFTNKYQGLRRWTSALEEMLAAVIEAKRIEDLALEQKRLFDEATLTGYWKFPIIKGLNYVTPTHTDVTNELGKFQCQPGENVNFSLESLSLTSIACDAILNTKTTNNVSLSTTVAEGFKDWKEEAGKQVIITKVLFGLFGTAIKTAFAQEEEGLKFITAELTDEQKAKTVGESLSANNLNLLVQNVLGTTEEVVLPTSEQATAMLVWGWKESKVFVDEDTRGTLPTSPVESKKSSGGGCVYNPNSKSSSDIGVVLLLVLTTYYLLRRKRLNLK